MRSHYEMDVIGFQDRPSVIKKILPRSSEKFEELQYNYFARKSIARYAMIISIILKE